MEPMPKKEIPAHSFLRFKVETGMHCFRRFKGVGRGSCK
jgi:hypothetical protein